MNKIWGIGLPRTGTTSLAEAINLLGFKSSHYCVLQSGEPYMSDILESAIDNDAVINNHLQHIYKRVFQLEQMDNKIGLYVLTYRLDKYVIENLKYMTEVYSFFERMRKLSHLLLIDINENEKQKWEKLSIFLGKTPPTLSFPHLNQGMGI